ncbi:MAG: carboxypeptidase regulatory-like domain-containing protein [Thermoplasmatota archaeon]
MAELGRRMNIFAALLLCASMLTGFLVLAPENSEAQGLEGWIVGTVTDESSNPVEAYILAMMMMSGGGPSGGFWTDPSGNFNITVYGGFEFIVLAANGSYYLNSTIAISVADEEVRADITLTPIAPLVADVVITGFVKDTDGNPVTGGNIIGYINDPASMGDGMPLYCNMTQPDVTGLFSVNVIPGTVGGGVGAFDFVGYDSSENQTDDPLVSGMTYWMNLTLAAPVNTDDARISGHVYDADTGFPLANAVVQYDSYNEWMERGGYSNFTFTDSFGYYEMNVTNGTADVWFSRSGYSMNMYEEIDVNPSDDIVLDAWLVPHSATIMGNVTDGSTGLGIGMARVYTNDFLGNVSMTITDSLGEYTLDTFDGTDIAIGAESDGYSRTWSMIDIAPGETLWMDFVLWPVDAWMNGTVIDKYSRLPVPNANLQVRSMVYEDWVNADGMGEYNFTSLVSGDYTLQVWAMNYRDYNEPVTVVPGANYWVVELTPWDVPDTCKLYGWINDSDTGSPLSGAEMEIGIGPEDHSETNSMMTDGSGYYEMWIPAIPLIWVANATDHEHASGVLNATGLTEVEVSTSLVPDTWMPNVTLWDQAPLENVSTVRPSVTDIEFDEEDVSSIQLWHFGFWYNDGMWDYFINVQFLYTNLDPLAWPSDSVPYSVVGDHYTIHYEWSAQTTGGLLWNSTDSQYLPCWTITWGPDTYDALRGSYMNASAPFWQSGTMYFDRDTGTPYTYQFDMGGGQADLSDPTGVFAPEGQVVQKDPGSSWWMWIGSQQIGQWSVSGLQFTFDTTVASGEYLMVFGVSDWGNHGMGDSRLIAVDTDPPVADAGPDQSADTNIPTLLDGTASSDNVGVAIYRWEYVDDLGDTVVLFGETVSTTFHASGSYDVTLTVWDAAGNEDSDTLTVTASDTVPPIAEAGLDQFVMSGELVYFDASASSDNVGIVNWTWTFTSDGVDHTLWGENVSFIFGLDLETVLVTLTVTDGDGNSDSDTMTVNVSGWIPEFPTLLIPVMLIAAVVIVASRRKR